MNFCVKIMRDDTGQEIMQQQLNGNWQSCRKNISIQVLRFTF